VTSFVGLSWGAVPMTRSVSLAILAAGLTAAFALPISATPYGAKSPALQNGQPLYTLVQKKASKGPQTGACKEAVVETGAQWPFENMARNSAKNDWVQKVRFLHGELYIDINKAKNVKYRCNPTGVLGLIRCEISARPCKEL